VLMTWTGAGRCLDRVPELDVIITISERVSWSQGRRGRAASSMLISPKNCLR